MERRRSHREVAEGDEMTNAELMVDLGITEKIVREPLPLGNGYGFRLAVFHNGVELPNGMNGVADIVEAQLKATK